MLEIQISIFHLHISYDINFGQKKKSLFFELIDNIFYFFFAQMIWNRMKKNLYELWTSYDLLVIKFMHKMNQIIKNEVERP